MSEILFDKNAPYLFGAYGVFLGSLLLYFVSLGLRRRSMEQDEEIVTQIERDSQQNANSSKNR
jgi:hypothetical protein